MGFAVPGRPTRRRRPSLRVVLTLLLGGLLLGLMPSVGAPTRALAAPQCSSGVNAEAPASRYINLVLDDSGSMFRDDSGDIDRWSKAKYALSVFAAMLGADDTLNVYLMSDFVDGRPGGVAVALTGGMPASDRVAKIAALQMRGLDTPYSPVQQAFGDLAAAPSADRWLVILTDGSFNDRTDAEVQSDLFGFAATSTADARLSVAFLGIGPNGPNLPNAPDQGVHFTRALQSSDLTAAMNGFANTIFQRNVIANTSGLIAPDIDLSEVIVFAQGPGVKVGDASTPGRTVRPDSQVSVTWVPNEDITTYGGLTPVPDRSLNGVLAYYPAVSRADGIQFAIQGAEDIAVFYKPVIRFGLELTDSSGRVVEEDKIVGGDYTVTFGFKDADCRFITSGLLGDITYSAQVIRNGDVVAQNFKDGDKLTLERGDVELDVQATYLGTNTSRARFEVRVLQPARATAFDVAAPTYAATALAGPAPEPIVLDYGVGSPGSLTGFAPEEWASITPEDFTVTGPPGLDFTVAVGAKPGQVLVTPHATNGDPFAVQTGTVPFTISASHVFDEQLYHAELASSFVVNDDLSWLDRALNWFATVGWKLLISLLIVVLILGYIVKPRFSKKLKRSPTVSGVPISISQRAETGNGKFRVVAARRFLPYLADTATLSYVPRGVGGFRTMKLKARRGGKMTLLNWRAIAERKNVSLNGTDLDGETRRPPILSPSTNITATVPNQMRYELYPNT